MAAEKETVLWQGRPSYWNWWPQLLIGDLAFLTGVVMCFSEHRPLAPGAFGVAFLAYLMMGLGRLGVLYRVTDQRVSARSGLFSRRVDEVETRDIRNIILEQTFVERLLGHGTIGVASAGGDGIEVHLSGIREAVKVKELIRKARMESGAPAPVD